MALSNREKELLEYLAQVKKLEQLEKEKQYLEDEIYKNKYGIKKSELHKLGKYFQKKE